MQFQVKSIKATVFIKKLDKRIKYLTLGRT